MLWILPLEPLPERYTEQWWRWFAEACIKRRIPYQMVSGYKLTDRVRVGRVLDAAGTNYWKLYQMAQVAMLFAQGQIKNGDKFFTMDLWHPSIESIPYMANLYNLDVKLYGFLHAGSYTLEDFAESMAPWAHHFERGWIKICHKVFVGSEYHATEVVKKRAFDPEYAGKIINTGNPFNSLEILKDIEFAKPVQEREKIVIFPHRFDQEKHPEIFIEMINSLHARGYTFKTIISTGRKQLDDPNKYLAAAKFPYEIITGLNKQDYHRTLAKARVMVSTAVDEHFGYCTAESIICGCSVVVPNNWSYPELLDNDARFMYASIDEAVSKIGGFLEAPVGPSLDCIKKYDQATDCILDEMA